MRAGAGGLFGWRRGLIPRDRGTRRQSAIGWTGRAGSPNPARGAKQPRRQPTRPPPRCSTTGGGRIASPGLSEALYTGDDQFARWRLPAYDSVVQAHLLDVEAGEDAADFRMVVDAHDPAAPGGFQEYPQNLVIGL